MCSPAFEADFGVVMKWLVVVFIGVCFSIGKGWLGRGHLLDVQGRALGGGKVNILLDWEIPTLRIVMYIMLFSFRGLIVGNEGQGITRIYGFLESWWGLV